jgi:hypothetical protein
MIALCASSRDCGPQGPSTNLPVMLKHAGTHATMPRPALPCILYVLISFATNHSAPLELCPTLAHLWHVTGCVPQSPPQSYANIAGVPAVMGLYGAFLPVLVYSLCGTCRQLGVGPVVSCNWRVGCLCLVLAWLVVQPLLSSGVLGAVETGCFGDADLLPVQNYCSFGS